MAFKLALAGVGNTGKSTVINKLKTDLTNEGYTVSHYGEVARQVLQSKGNGDVLSFQEEILKQELERLPVIYNDDSDIILIDRTVTDNNVYALFNGIGTPIHKGKYDLVFLFTEPFKDTTTEGFTHYNDDALNVLMQDIIMGAYDVKVIPNGSHYEDIKNEIEKNLR